MTAVAPRDHSNFQTFLLVLGALLTVAMILVGSFFYSTHSALKTSIEALAKAYKAEDAVAEIGADLTQARKDLTRIQQSFDDVAQAALGAKQAIENDAAKYHALFENQQYVVFVPKPGLSGIVNPEDVSGLLARTTIDQGFTVDYYPRNNANPPPDQNIHIVHTSDAETQAFVLQAVYEGKLAEHSRDFHLPESLSVVIRKMNEDQQKAAPRPAFLQVEIPEYLLRESQ